MSDMSEPTPGLWRIPGANVFRVVAPDAPHQNKPSGMCPPYEWAIVCETDPESVGGPQAAANARLIAAAPDLLAACKALLAAIEAADEEHAINDLSDFPEVADAWEAADQAAKVAIAKAEGVKVSMESTTP